jgi:DNA helicase-2/ATP-dependent DNA helicase PcrA
MRNQGGIWATLADAYEEYRDSLETNLSCDFSHLQLKFIDFLASPNGARFVDGEGSPEHPGIQYILVDEYQDTNLIQESIYLELARRTPHNLCVVGDDDQALYRFRGGTVECMVNFDAACRGAWENQVQVTQQPLSTNYRSHPDIVNWCDNYIRSFAIMNMPGARVPNKPNLISDQNWTGSRQARGAVIGSYPSVSYLVGQGQGQKKKETQQIQESDVVNQFADLVQGLLNNGIIQDPSQCVLLLKSTQAWSAGTYQDALEQRGIEVYNPRNRTFLEQPEIQTALGALITILDPNQAALSTISKVGIQNTINNWLTAYNQIAANSPNLVDYINRAVARISQIAANQNVYQLTSQGIGHTIASIQDIFYHLMSFDPFVTWQQDHVQTVRLGKLSKVIESYCSLPFPNFVGSTRGNLRIDRQNAGQINAGQLNHIYYSLIGLLVSGGLNDPEEQEIICPPGQFPIMTVHQAKGLEFPFVFVSKLAIQNVTAGSELQLEDSLRQFRINPAPVTFNAQERAEQDYIRFFYVAYSRAECALVLLTTAEEFGQQGLGFGGYGQQWFTQQAQELF